MVFRAIALSLALLIGAGVLIPLATNDAEAGPRKSSTNKKKREWKGVKKYSKRWWQLYRAQERRKRALARKRRALRLRQLRLAQERAAAQNNETVAAVSPKTESKKPQAAPRVEKAKTDVKTAQTSPGELKFRVDDSAGSQVGSASITVVGPAVIDNTPGRGRSVGGVSTSILRRDVINRMIQENGWVVNDYQKEIGGRPVYVVVAQSQTKGGRVQSRMFYFTEVDGRIYNVATNSPVEESTRLAEESEKVINSLQNRVRPVQRASK